MECNLPTLFYSVLQTSGRAPVNSFNSSDVNHLSPVSLPTLGSQNHLLQNHGWGKVWASNTHPAQDHQISFLGIGLEICLFTKCPRINTHRSLTVTALDRFQIYCPMFRSASSLVLLLLYFPLSIYSPASPRMILWKPSQVLLLLLKTLLLAPHFTQELSWNLNIGSQIPFTWLVYIPSLPEMKLKKCTQL